MSRSHLDDDLIGTPTFYIGAERTDVPYSASPNIDAFLISILEFCAIHELFDVLCVEQSLLLYRRDQNHECACYEVCASEKME